MSTAMVKEEARPNDVVGAGAVVSDLPVGIISDILSRLPVDDMARCKAVCKSWDELSKDPHFPHQHFTASSQDTNSVLLQTADGFSGMAVDIGTGLYLTSNNKDGKWKSIPLTPEEESDVAHMWLGVQASCKGLLCLKHYYFYEEGPKLVYNPLTKKAIQLPQLNFHPDYDKWNEYKSAFGFDPITNKYKLVLAYKRKCRLDGTSRMTAAILTLGETSWRTLQFPHDLQTAILYHQPLFFNGAFHWVIGKRPDFENRTCVDGILTLDITTENFQIINFLPSLEIPYLRLEQVQIENSLAFASLMDNDHHSFEIWQIQGANMDGTCLYKHRTFIVQVDGFSLIDAKEFRLLGAFHNGVFLFQAFLFEMRLRNHLVLYDTRKDQASVIEISGVPKTFKARIFSPSFISPTL